MNERSQGQKGIRHAMSHGGRNQTCPSDSGGEYNAFTLPDIGIFAADGVFSSSAIDGKVMMQHEFGHVLQYRIVGKKFYYGVIAKESAMNCKNIWPYNGISHSEYWTETWANYLSKHYFGERWLGMEKLLEQARNFYYPSKNVDLPFLIKKRSSSFLII